MQDQTNSILPLQSEAQILMMMMNKDYKSNDELQIILSRLSTITYFNQFIEQYLSASKNDQLMKLCSHLKMEKFAGGDVVIKEGDVSNNKLYIIFQGTCLMIRKKPMDNLQDDGGYQRTPVLIATPLVQQAGEVGKGWMFAKKLTAQLFQIQADRTITSQQKKHLTELYGQPFKMLKKGEGFGEKALMHNQNRALTVAANSQELHLVILLKDDFQMIQKFIERELKDKQELVFQIFRNVINEYSSARLDTMVYSFETVEYDKNTVLTIEEEKGFIFFIIQSGERYLNSKYTHMCDGYYSLLDRKGQGNLLGEEIVINKTKIYDFTAVVTSTMAKIMVIDAVQFHVKFPMECKEQIIRDYKAKVASRQQTYLKVIVNRKNQLSILSTYQDPKVNLEAFSQLYQQKSKLQVVHRPNKTTFDGNEIQNKQQFTGRIFKSFFQEGTPSTITAQTFNTNLSPTVGNYCIQWIVSKQGENHYKNIQNKPPVNQSVEPYDFGKHELEDARHKQYIFEIKNNLVHALPKYTERDQTLLTQVIKRRFLKSMSSKHRSKENLLLTTQRIFSRPNMQSQQSQNELNSKSSLTKIDERMKTSLRYANKTQKSSPRNETTIKLIALPIHLRPLIKKFTSQTNLPPVNTDLS